MPRKNQDGGSHALLPTLHILKGVTMSPIIILIALLEGMAYYHCSLQTTLAPGQHGAWVGRGIAEYSNWQPLWWPPPSNERKQEG